MKLAALAIVALSACASPVAAQDLKCSSTEEVYSLLTETLGNPRKMWAQVNPDQVLEFWGGKNGWVLFATLSNGMSCAVAAGTDWGMVPDL